MGTEKLEEKKQGKEASAVSLRMDCSPLDVSSPHLQALCVEQEDGAEEPAPSLVLYLPDSDE